MRRNDASHPFRLLGPARSLRVTLVGVTVGIGLVASAAVPADAAPANPAERLVAAKLSHRVKAKALGRNTTGMVLDASTGRVIWSRRSGTGLMPASVAKLATALTAVEVLGPDYRVTTRVVQRTTRGALYLVGGGDALLTSRQVYVMARTSAATLRSRGVRSVAVRVDDSRYPKPVSSRGWKKSYVPSEVSPVRALVVNGRQRRDTAIDAGKTFRNALTRYGITVTSVARAHRPAGAYPLASHVSPPMRTWLSRMLLNSDNDIAENVLRQAALGAGRPATWGDARAVRNAVLHKYGITGVRLYDGSGLSRSDRMTAAGTARLLRVVFSDSQRDDVLGWLPVSGKTGTLKASYHRFYTKPASCAKGRVRAKTGTLDDAAALAGIATATNGAKRVFVLFENGKRSGRALKRAIDNLAATATGCY